MKKRIISSFFVLPLVAGLTFSSCGNDKSEEELDGNQPDSSSTVAPVVTETEEVSFQVPSPGEMLTFIKSVGKKGNKVTTFLNSPDNAKNYVDAKSKALNFGIYSCDLSYCSIFEIGSDVLKYFKTVKQLGDEIGVASSIRPELMKRLDANASNADSLAVISDQMYNDSFETLQNGQQGNTLALVIAGGYIESLYIVTNLVTFEKGSDGVQRIADQKIALENIIGFMKKYESDASVAETIKSLESLKAEFDKLKEHEVSSQKTEGKVVLGGGSEIEITAEQYKTISDKVKEVRNSFTMNK